MGSIELIYYSIGLILILHAAPWVYPSLKYKLSNCKAQRFRVAQTFFLDSEVIQKIAAPHWLPLF